MPSGNCELIYEESVDGYRLKFDYQGWNKSHKDFLFVLKGLIPSSDREYNPVTKIWFISAHSNTGMDYYKLLEPLLDATFYPVFKFSKADTEQYKYGQVGGIKISVNDEINKFNKLMIELTLPQLNDKTEQSEATKIYRKAALLLHPDRNQGNGEKMSILNET